MVGHSVILVSHKFILKSCVEITLSQIREMQWIILLKTLTHEDMVRIPQSDAKRAEPKNDKNLQWTKHEHMYSDLTLWAKFDSEWLFVHYNM